MDGAKCRGVHRHTRRREVVITHRLHAHDREQTADGGQLLGRADADGAMAFLVQALDFARQAQGFGHIRRARQYFLVDLADQLQQGPVQRYFSLVHRRHGCRELCADAVGADEGLSGHRETPGEWQPS
ncbi:hypothetical protein D9M71_263410 [compost metagenome]